MSGEQPTRRVIALAPMPPEKSAYALARYSRSPDSIESSLRWVHGHSSEKFWDQFYFDYGHASIADLGHVIICFENISELAAIRLEDEPLWDGQAKSSRYQNFASGGWFVPDSIRGSETEGTYYGILRSLAEIYRLLHQPVTEFLSKREPCSQSMGLFFTHVFENVGMTVNVMPITCIPLPFFSYGGSFLLATAIALGLVLRVAWESRRAGYAD